MVSYNNTTKLETLKMVVASPQNLVSKSGTASSGSYLKGPLIFSMN